jgi:hypothetical protein
MRDLPLDPTGAFAMPWFSSVDDDGTPNASRVAGIKRLFALQRHLCWTCGRPLTRFKSFVLGPVQVVPRSTSELPSHVGCNRYALLVCPFLTNPKRRRSDQKILEQMRDYVSTAPVSPGVFALWVTRSFEVVSHSRFNVGDPVQTTWWTQGRPATAEEIETAQAIAHEALK